MDSGKESGTGHGDISPTRSRSSTSLVTSESTPTPQVEVRDHEKDAGSSTGNDLALRRTASTHQSSIVSRVRSRQFRGSFTHPLSHTKTSDDVIVEFDGPDDPYRPMNWVLKKKLITTALYGFTTMGVTLASSIYSPGVRQIAQEFNVGEEVGSLGVSLLLFGFAVGPLLWAPLSEVYGRKIAVLAPYVVGICFTFGTATAKDIQTVMITRFFTGFFGSAPVTNTGGVLGDLFPPEIRGVALVFYAITVVGGPLLGPIIGGAIVQSYLRWRWTEYINGIYMCFILVLDVIYIDESYPPVLLVYKARRLRFETGNWALHARHEEWDVSIKELAVKFLIRPFQMLATPICFLIALYTSFIYGIIYLNLGAFPIMFQEARGWGQLVGQLPFLALAIGVAIGGVLNVFNQRYYVKRMRAAGNRAVPEARLPPMMAGSVMIAAALFIMGWTSDKKYPWIAPCIGAVMMGFGFFTILQAGLNYLVDTFQKYAASAVAANTFLRSAFAGAFPLIVTPMYHNLGIPWASSLLGFIAVAMIPIPYLFFIYGKRLRARGKWSAASV